MANINKSFFVQLIGLIVIVLVVDVIGGFFIGKKVLIPILYDDDFVEDTQGSVEQGDKDSSRVLGIKKVLDAINLNPSLSNGEIFSCDVVLEAEDQAVVDEITSRDYEIMDELSTYLSFKTVDELNDPSNWETYKKDMFDIVNNIVTSGNISSLYIPSKIIQFE